MDSVDVLGVRVDRIDVPRLHEFIRETIERDERAMVLNVNVNCLNLAWGRPWLRALLNAAPVVFCDGAGVQLGARILGQPPPARIAYNQWMWGFARFAAAHDYRAFFLGARPGVGQRAAERLRAATPEFQVVGIRDGYFDKTPGSSENEAVIAEINESGAELLLVSFGMPVQEQWLADSWHQLDVKVAFTAGAALDYLSGELPMPPVWMASHGLEWLHRLSLEPARLWRRYLVGNPLFLYRVGCQRLGRMPTDFTRDLTPTAAPLVDPHASRSRHVAGARLQRSQTNR